MDEAELAAADRSLITRSVLLAYQYTGDTYDLSVDVKRYEESSVLSAVADRTQLTSVLTEAGELLTQASFMVKNNDKQFQRFLLPTNASFWSCYVNGQPAKPERDQDWLLVPLPRREPRSGVRRGHRLCRAESSVVIELVAGAATARAADRRAEHLRRVAAIRADLEAALQFWRQHERGAGHGLRRARCVEKFLSFTARCCGKSGRACSCSGCWRFWWSCWW